MFSSVVGVAVSAPVFFPGQPSGVRPLNLIKPVNSVFIVDPSTSVPPVINVPPVAQVQTVGTRLSLFWETWQSHKVSDRVVKILKEGYTLPFKTRPNLVRHPIVKSGYVHVPRQDSLMEALHALIQKNAVEKVTQRNSLGFFNRLFWYQSPTTSGALY